MTKNFTNQSNLGSFYLTKYRSQTQPTVPSGTVQTFNILNTESTTSKGFIRIGLIFKKGDIPDLVVPTIKRNSTTIDAQFDKQSYWPDRSLLYCVCHIRDTDFSASEERTYTVEAELNFFNNTGTKSLSDITSNTDFKVELDTVQRFTKDTTTIAETTTDSPTYSTSWFNKEVLYKGAGGNYTGPDAVTVGHLEDPGDYHAVMNDYGTGANLNIFAPSGVTYVPASGQSGSNITDAVSRTLTPTECIYIENNAGTLEYTIISENDSLSTTLFSDFNTLSATSTRVEKIHSGSIAETWIVWGMVNDGVSTDHAHIKSEYEVTIWKNSNDTINDYEYSVTMCQDWWSVANKYRQNYNLVLKDNTTTIETYTGVYHHYHGRWQTVDKTSTEHSLYGRPFWKTSAPTLHYKPDRAYWISTNVIPPFDLTIASAVLADTPHNAPFVPCDNLNHRAFVDDTGAYMGRGALPDADVMAFISQDAELTRYARVNAHAGLHVPYHYRSNENRTRPGESADTANTLISFILTDPINGVEDDFTGEGMPAPQHACVTSSTYPSGYVTPVGGKGVWISSANASHGVSYSYFMYLLEGNHYFYSATLSHATNLIHQANDGVDSTNPALMYSNDTNRSGLSIPTDVWTGIAPLGKAQTRGVGWAAYIMANAYSIAAKSDIATRCLKNWIKHSCEWCYQSEPYLPTSQTDTGMWYDYTTNEDYLGTSPWMSNFLAMGLTKLSTITEHRGANVAADIAGLFTKGLWSGDFYKCMDYYVQKLPKSGKWVASTNEYLNVDDIGYKKSNVDWTASTGVFTYTSERLPFAAVSNDDVVRLWGKYENGGSVTFDAALTEGTEYHVVETSGNTFKLSATQGGSAITGSTDGSYVVFFKTCQNAQVNTGAATVQWNDDDYAPIAYITANMINRRDNTIITDTLMNTIKTRMGNWSPTIYFGWASEQ